MKKPFDPTKPCQTRGGDPVKILTTDAVGICPIFYQNERTRAVHSALLNGKAWEEFECELDLVNITEKLVGWVNFYKRIAGPAFRTSTYETEDAARAYSNDPGYIETRKIEVEVEVP